VHSLLKVAFSIVLMFFSVLILANDNTEKPSPEEETALVKPVYSMSSEKVYLKIPSNGDKKLSISVYNESGDLVYQERFKSPNASLKVLNFEKSEKGSYTIRVWNSNGKYLESFEVK